MIKNIFKIVKLNIVIACLLLTTSCYKEYPLVLDFEEETVELYIGYNPIFLDFSSNMALISLSEYQQFNGIVSYNGIAKLLIDGIEKKNGDEVDLGEVDQTTNISIEISSDTILRKIFTLYFTLLPILSINHPNATIPSEPKIKARLKLFEPQGEIFTKENCKIETRGASANAFEKKSFAFELFKDNYIDEKNSSLLNMRFDDDWILDATYIDVSNIRNRVSFELWRAIQNDAILKGRNTLFSAIDGKYVELFINNEYYGIYCLSETVDAKFLGLNKNKSNNSFLYKSEQWTSATTLSGLPDTIESVTKWAGWEQKYPSPETYSCWSNIYKYVDFVYNSSNSTFESNASSYVIFDQAIDYFILINTIMGYDNAGKNIFMAQKEQNFPFYLCPWDMDATWGRNGLGDIEKLPEQGIVTFNLYRRLNKTNPENYLFDLKKRWFDLRKDIITKENIISKFTAYNQLLIESGAIEREEKFWGESLADPIEEQAYIEKWLEERLKFLDNYFNTLEVPS